MDHLTGSATWGDYRRGAGLAVVLIARGWLMWPLVIVSVLVWALALPVTGVWMLCTGRRQHTPRNYWRYAAEWMDWLIAKTVYRRFAPLFTVPSWPPRGASGKRLWFELG